jgi:hypothetical protein
MRGRVVLASVVMGLVLAAMPAAAAATSLPGPNGKIVFASGRGNSEVPSPADFNDNAARIWVADYPSGTPVQVTTQPAGAEVQHRHPNWSPDHTRIVYAAGKPFTGPFALWIVDLRTGEQTEFVGAAPGQDRPTWSPDGSRIAYGREGDIWVKGVAPGSEPVQITNTAPVDERPVWSPDGNTLYFNRGVEGNRGIYKVSPVAPGGAVEAVIDTASDEWQPAVNPSGTRLCYLSGPKNDGATLRTVNVNGTGDTLFRDDATLGDLNCVWSPDGKRILYSEGAFGSGELRTLDINGGSFEALNGMSVAKHFDGNADWATNFSPKCDNKSFNVGVNGFITVALSCTDPDAGAGAEPPRAVSLEDEALEIVAPPAHGSIGGLSNGKVVYTPPKDFKGTDTFTYTGSDGVSNAPPATVTLQVGAGGGGGGQDKTPPGVSNIKISAKRWRLGKGLAKISVLPIGTTISFKLSEAATAAVSFQRATPGRKVGKSCVKQTAQNRTKKSCTRYVNAGSLKPLGAKAGQNKVRFQGRLSKSRSLSPSAYRVVVGATDAAGNSSKPKNGPSFTIVAG